jgi:Fe-Mn family superoxide dismutase
MSKEQLTIHHDKHHAAYANGVNAVLEKIERSRRESSEIDMKATLKEMSFHLGGHKLHSLFWGNLAPAKGKNNEPKKELLAVINNEFGSFNRFKEEFSKTALSVEGSGWAALSFCRCTKRPLIMQIEKHSYNVYPNFRIIMVLDVWEHAYYLDYKNDRAKYIDAFWNIVNWDKIAERFEKMIK